MTPDELAELIAKSLRLEYRQSGKEYFYVHNRRESTAVHEDELAQICKEISSYHSVDDFTVTTRTSYEVLVRHHRLSLPLRTLREGIEIEDTQQGIRYRVSTATEPFLIHLLAKRDELESKTNLRLLGNLPMSHYIDRVKRDTGDWSPIEVLRSSTFLVTLQIVSDRPRPASFWQTQAESMFFHLGYNLDIAIMPLGKLEDTSHMSQVSRVRRSRPADLDAPRRHYIRDLVYHYQLGVSAESPMLEYLSYYHVAEHWFENVFQADLVEQVQGIITSPGFSYRRKKDVGDLIRKINKAVQLRNEETVINEQVALRLTLQNHVDLRELSTNIAAVNPKLLDHYTEKTVRFSDGDRVDLRSSDTDAVFGQLSKRIYKTRNSLVHSKDGTKGKFTPFSDDSELIPEIPLMRLIAEQIVVSTSTPQHG